MKSLHKFEHQVRFEEVDRQGILFYARTFPIAHACLEDFCRHAQFGYDYWFTNPEFAVPIKHTSCDYSRPIRLNEKILIEMSLQKTSHSTLTFTFDFYTKLKTSEGSEASQLCARVESTHIFVDQKSFHKVAVPQQILQELTS